MIKFSATLLATLIAASVNAATVDLRIMETTDLHSNMMDFDYYKDAATEKFGLVRTATLIEKARQEVKNSVLVDNGDVIQGSPLGDYMAAKGLNSGDVHPVYKAMNTLDYAVGNLGNHEFNYGLDFLHKALAGAKFPYVNANIIDTKTGQPMFTPYLIKETAVQDRDGKTQTLRIGYIGFVPPQIMTWDKANLSGKVTVNDITETARQYVPEMRKKGADVVVVVAHSGLSADPYHAMAENSVYYLSQVPGVDAIMFGHAHAVFPGKDFAAIQGADIDKGTLNGIPAVMPGMWGDHLGVVDLVLNNDAGQWRVAQAKAEARPVYDAVAKKSLAAEDANMVKVLKADHDATREFRQQTHRPVFRQHVQLSGAGAGRSYRAGGQYGAESLCRTRYSERPGPGNAAGTFCRRAVQSRRPQKRPDQLRRGGERPTHLPQCRRSLSLPEYSGGDEGQW